MSWCDFVAGCIGGSAGVFVGHPLDTLKVMVQTGTFQSVHTCCVLTYKQKGVPGFYRGVTFPFLSSGIINCIFFGAYGYTCRRLGEPDYINIIKERRPHYGIVFAAGSAGGLVQLIAATPIELVKVKLQAENLKLGSAVSSRNTYSTANFRGSFDCLRKLWNNGGLRGCYQGIGAHSLRDVVGYGIYMSSYEWCLYHMGKFSNHKVINTLTAGGMAGMICWAAITPLDVLKSRIQADDILARRYKSTLHCFKQSYTECGFSVFFRGLSLTMLRAFPVNATTFLIYSSILGVFQSVTNKP